MRRMLVLLLSLSSCSRCNAQGTPDVPVPADEPRATLKLSLDLERGATCEESFDLAVYRDRAVDLVTWQGRSTGTGRCSGRVVIIRYLPRRLGRDALLGNVRKLATKMEILEG